PHGPADRDLAAGPAPHRRRGAPRRVHRRTGAQPVASRGTASCRRTRRPRDRSGAPLRLPGPLLRAEPEIGPRRPAGHHGHPRPRRELAGRSRPRRGRRRRDRDALQAVTGTSGTRLRRADQDAVAALTGHATADDHHRVLAEAARAVTWELHRAVRAAEAARATGGSATRGAGTARRPALQHLAHGVLVHAGEISVDPESSDPLRDLAAIRHAATTGLPLSAATLARLAEG